MSHQGHIQLCLGTEIWNLFLWVEAAWWFLDESLFQILFIVFHTRRLLGWWNLKSALRGGRLGGDWCAYLGESGLWFAEKAFLNCESSSAFGLLGFWRFDEGYWCFGHQVFRLWKRILKEIRDGFSSVRSSGATRVRSHSEDNTIVRRMEFGNYLSRSCWEAGSQVLHWIAHEPLLQFGCCRWCHTWHGLKGSGCHWVICSLCWRLYLGRRCWWESQWRLIIKLEFHWRVSYLVSMWIESGIDLLSLLVLK